MTDFTINSALNALKTGTIDQFICDLMEHAMNVMMQAELTEHLDYEKHDRRGWEVDNSRNGFYNRKYKSRYGDIKLEVPRDRKGEFQTKLFDKYQRNDSKLEASIIMMYQNGVTTQEIAGIIEKMYGHHYSKQTVSNITDTILEDVARYHERRLEAAYKVIYLDATFVPVRRDVYVDKEAILIVLGIKEDGTKEIVDYTISPTESASAWRGFLGELISRGLQAPELVVSDGLTGLRDDILELFESTRYQQCFVHVERNVLSKVSSKDRETVAKEFSQIHKQSSREEAQQVLNAFLDKWRVKYPRMVKQLEVTESLLTFYDFPGCIRSSIYTTNIIEGFNSILKRQFKKREQFVTVNALDKVTFLQVMQYNAKFSDKTHKGFGKL